MCKENDNVIKFNNGKQPITTFTTRPTHKESSLIEMIDKINRKSKIKLKISICNFCGSSFLYKDGTQPQCCSSPVCFIKYTLLKKPGLLE